jgi:hypothetical protein
VGRTSENITLSSYNYFTDFSVSLFNLEEKLFIIAGFAAWLIAERLLAVFVI